MSREFEIPFVRRHVGPSELEQREMLEAVGFASLEELVEAAMPEGIRSREGLRLPEPATEPEALRLLGEVASENRVARSMIGAGYFGTHTPAVIRRSVLENPAWYTAYTPYQPEISQGRLEALLNFQTMVSDLTGLAVAGASLLDEGTAAAEAMAVARRVSKSSSGRFLVDADTLPQTKAVLAVRAEPLGVELVEVDGGDAGSFPQEYFGVLLSSPGASGRLRDCSAAIAHAHERGALAAVACDLLALTVSRSPGSMGADMSVGSAQRFGVPMGFGGPHAGFMSVRSGLERSLPGRLVGVSKDEEGRPAYRLALQTREQHIRRQKATSNICTAQVLLAVMASCFAVYHGPRGLADLARGVRGLAWTLAEGLRAGGVEVESGSRFDTVTVRVPGRAEESVRAAAAEGVNLRLVDADTVGIACDETTERSDLEVVWRAFGVSAAEFVEAPELPQELRRESDFLTHPVFERHHSETSMLRYLRRLSDLDLALDRGMIPLGSCTMKLNAASEMEPISWPQFAQLHPFAPAEQTAGYRRMAADLERWLAEVTGYDAVSLQPNAGSQGELAGLLAIRAYHERRGQSGRRVCLIPSSAHGTNAASAVMAGMSVVVVACDADGNVDMADLEAKLERHGEELAAIMVTYPSTHGVYEQTVSRLCELVHAAGGQVYVDGANLNALLGFAKPGEFGADVSHLNLHKTFCIPHGGGGPGVGPVAVRSHLAPYLPGRGEVGPVASAPLGSAGILPIPWMYLRMMGGEGLTAATGVAVLAANYVARRLSESFPVLYAGSGGLVAHECILDLRELTKRSGVTVEDVAKRLIDYGFHAPTMSFPVAGTLMVEPTESENLEELDRFCEAMIAIRGEIDRVVGGDWPREDNPLRRAPHTAEAVSEDKWDRPYSRREAAWPAGMSGSKYWAPTARIDSAWGDRNLACACPPPEAFEV